MNKIAIVGAGPAGVFCALTLVQIFKESNFNNFSITIFDKSQALRTILKTGNGRCNITNAVSDMKDFCSNYPRGEKFLYSLFSRFSNYDAIDYFSSVGIQTYIQDDNRVFPVSNSAKDVRDKLLNKLKSSNKIKLINREIKSKVDLKDFDYVVLSCGSRGVEALLASYEIPFLPYKKALCGLKIKDNIFPKGVSVKSLDGDFVFTDFGVSGPLIFKLSSIYADKNFPYKLKINLFEAEKLIELVKENPKKSIGNLVSKFIPKSLAQVVVKDYLKNSCEISKKELNELSYLNLEVIETAPCGEIVNSGGVDLNFVDKNCKSKIIDSLWFCGEILNIDGFCGGFNLQNCWSGGFVVANDICNIIIEKER